MRVSKTFHEAAGALLYSNVIIKEKTPISSVVEGWRLRDKESRGCRPIVHNLKKTLLSFVQHLTIVTHTCNVPPLTPTWHELGGYFHDKIPSECFTGLKTILVLPYALCHESELLCRNTYHCLIMTRLRARKVVIHNIRFRDWSDPPDGPMGSTSVSTVPYSALTVVLDETDCNVVDWNQQRNSEISHTHTLESLRVVVHKTPAWLDRIAQRETCSKRIVDTHRLISAILIPAIRRSAALGSISIEIYLFREIDPHGTEMGMIRRALDHEPAQFDLPVVLSSQLGGEVQRERSTYTIKSLSDYIEEGLEDEFIWQKMKYWHEENDRRKGKAGKPSGSA